MSVRGFEKLCGRDYCGREPALPAFSTGAHPLKRVGAVSCLLLSSIYYFLVAKIGLDIAENKPFDFHDFAASGDYIFTEQSSPPHPRPVHYFPIHSGDFGDQVSCAE